MSRSSARGQTEPLAAIVAVAAVCLGVSLYAGVLDARWPGETDRNVAEPTLERVLDRLAPAGLVRPERIEASSEAAPDGYEGHVSVAVSDSRWSTGPTPPSGASRASERVSVRVGPAENAEGTVRVAIWR